jgi:uncharacterized membrane protein (DUF2068 family)
MQTTPKNRPTGVTIIGILTIIGGILMLGSGIALAAVSAVLPNLASMNDQINGFEAQIPSMIPVSYLGVAALSIGSILIIIGVISLFVAYGLFKAKKWAWTINVVLSIINIAIGVVSIVTGNVGSIASIAISGIILYYLYRPHVKAYFGKAVQSKVATP